MGQVPKKIIFAQQGAKFKVRINGEDAEFTEQELDNIYATKKQELMDKGILNRRNEAEFNNVYSKVRDQIKSGTYNIDTGGPDNSTVIGMNYEGPENALLGVDAEGKPAKASGFRRAFSHSVGKDEQKLAALLNQGIAIGTAQGLQKRKVDEEAARKLAEAKAKEEAEKASNTLKGNLTLGGYGKTRYADPNFDFTRLSAFDKAQKMAYAQEHGNYLLTNRDKIDQLKGLDLTGINPDASGKYNLDEGTLGKIYASLGPDAYQEYQTGILGNVQTNGVWGLKPEVKFDEASKTYTNEKGELVTKDGKLITQKDGKYFIGDQEVNADGTPKAVAVPEQKQEEVVVPPTAQVPPTVAPVKLKPDTAPTMGELGKGILGDGELSASDKLAAGSMALDLAGLLTGAVAGSVGGSLVSSGLGLGSTLMQARADYKEDNDWSAGEMLGTGASAALDVATAIPYLGVGAQSLKIAKNLSRAGKILMVSGAIKSIPGLYNLASSLASGEKGLKDLTTDDIKSIAGGLRIAASGRQMAKVGGGKSNEIVGKVRVKNDKGEESIIEGVKMTRQEDGSYKPVDESLKDATVLTERRTSMPWKTRTIGEESAITPTEQNTGYNEEGLKAWGPVGFFKGQSISQRNAMRDAINPKKTAESVKGTKGAEAPKAKEEVVEAKPMTIETIQDALTKWNAKKALGSGTTTRALGTGTKTKALGAGTPKERGPIPMGPIVSNRPAIPMGPVAIRKEAIPLGPVVKAPKAKVVKKTETKKEAPKAKPTVKKISKKEDGGIILAKNGVGFVAGDRPETIFDTAKKVGFKDDEKALLASERLRALWSRNQILKSQLPDERISLDMPVETAKSAQRDLVGENALRSQATDLRNQGRLAASRTSDATRGASIQLAYGDKATDVENKAALYGAQSAAQSKKEAEAAQQAFATARNTIANKNKEYDYKTRTAYNAAKQLRQDRANQVIGEQWMAENLQKKTDILGNKAKSEAFKERLMLQELQNNPEYQAAYAKVAAEYKDKGSASPETQAEFDRIQYKLQYELAKKLGYDVSDLTGPTTATPPSASATTVGVTGAVPTTTLNSPFFKNLPLLTLQKRPNYNFNPTAIDYRKLAVGNPILKSGGTIAKEKMRQEAAAYREYMKDIRENSKVANSSFEKEHNARQAAALKISSDILKMLSNIVK